MGRAGGAHRASKHRPQFALPMRARLRSVRAVQPCVAVTVRQRDRVHACCDRRFFIASHGADIIGWSPQSPMNGQNAARLPIVFRDEVSKFDLDDVGGPALRSVCAGRQYPKAPVRPGDFLEVGASAGGRLHADRFDRKRRHCLPVGMPGNDRETARPNLDQRSDAAE